MNNDGREIPEQVENIEEAMEHVDVPATNSEARKHFEKHGVENYTKTEKGIKKDE